MQMCEIIFCGAVLVFFGYYHHEETTTILLIMNWARVSANKSQRSLSWAPIALSDVGLVSSSLFPGSLRFFPHVLYKVCCRPAVSFQNGEKKARWGGDETQSISPRKAGEMSPELRRVSLCPKQHHLLRDQPAATGPGRACG